MFDYVSFEGVDGLDMGIREGNIMIFNLSRRKNGSYHLLRWGRLQERGLILRDKVVIRGSVWGMLVLR